MKHSDTLRMRKKQESWTELLQDLRFTEEMFENEHIQYLRNRFVIGASEWFAGNFGSKENNKSKIIMVILSRKTLHQRS